jgi:hypothetical protein
MAIALLATALLFTSFLVGGSSASVVNRAAIGPLSSSPGHSRVAAVSSNASKATIRFSFLAHHLSTGQMIFALGTPEQGLIASISDRIEGQRYVVLTQILNGQAGVHLMLVSHVRPGAKYAVAIVIDNRPSIGAWIDGQRQFSYPLPTRFPPVALRSVRVGSGPLASSSFDGSVDGFRINYVQFGTVPYNTLQKTLRFLAGIAFALLAVLLAAWISTALWVASTLPKRDRELRLLLRICRIVGRRSLPIGTFALASGIVLLTVFTPIDNTILQQTGGQFIRSSGVGPGNDIAYALADEPKLMASAAVVDMDVSFLVRRTGPLPTDSTTHVLVSSSNNLQGVKFELAPGGVLLGSLAGEQGLLPVANYPLDAKLPLNQWVSIGLEIRRSQSYTFFVDHRPLQSFTWALPIVRPVPARLAITAPLSVAVRDLSLQVTMFQPPSNGMRSVLTRLIQGIGILLVIAGVLLVSRRLFSRIIPMATDASAPLVRIIFATAGIGVLINIVVDLLHFQHSQITYFERNTWLLSRYPRFADFFQPLDIFRSLNPYGIQSGNYPPFGYWLASPFVWLSQYAGLLVFLSISLGFIIWWSSRSFASTLTPVERIGVVIVTLFSLPVTFAIDRGNLDLVIFVLVVFGIATFEARRDGLSSAWLGIAAAAKGFPILFLLLFLRGRRLKYVAFGVVVGAFVTFAALLSFHGSVTQNIEGFRAAEHSLQNYFQQSVEASTYYNASLVGWAQSIGYAMNGAQGAASVQHVISHFVVPTDVVGGLALFWYVTWRETSLWRAVSLITIAALLLAEISNYYELLLLFVPVSLFVKYRKADRRSVPIAVLFGLLLAPKAYFYFGNFVETSVLVTAPLLVALGYLIIRDGSISRRRVDEGIRRAAAPSLETPELEMESSP